MRVFFVLLFILSVCSRSGDCWTPKTYQLIVVKSVRLMPVSFQRIMSRHKKEILTGCLNPDLGGEAAHRYDFQQKNGFLFDRISELTEQIPRKIEKHVPFREIAFDFGRLSHYMADLNDPLILDDGDPRENQYRADFAVYLEKNLDLFPWIFDGHDSILLQQSRLQDYIFSVASEAVEKYPRLGESYFPEGQLVSSDTFDWKSLPFGIASLSYSHSITDTVQIWFYTWKKSHGDITFTPLYSKKRSSK